jgi:saccharopine dehydrogenase-like NADP-dependent oxidoreductase
MNVLILGGAGDMGRHACRVAASLPGVDALVIADLAEDSAAKLAVELGPKARHRRLHVTDRASLKSALSQADIVLNTVGPFFRFGVSILEAAIAARCHYLDICDDWTPTLEMLELDSVAQPAGVIAVLGLGASPGIVNLLAVLAADELESTDTLLTGWNMDLAQPDPSGTGSSAAIEHGIEQLTGSIRVLRGGRLVEERPLRPVVVDYPGVGPRPARTFGHPEPVTLARTIAELRESFNVTFGSRSLIAQAVALGWLIDHRLLSPQRAARLAQWAEFRTAHDPRKEFTAAANGGLPPIFARAAGTHNDRAATIGATLSALPGTSMGAVTGIPLAVGLQLLVEGHINAAGVHAPEAAVDARLFFSALAEQCVGVEADDPIVMITRSWDPDPRSTFRSAMYQAGARLETREARAVRA